jgi:4-diphosphocytidyl-2-C-methyl-D-erythritol kinase
MIKFPNCKINIGLNILSKRADGYHNLQTVFYPVSLKDVLEIIENNGEKKHIGFSSSGFIIDGNTENNLCVKAARLLQKDFPQLPDLKIHLHKNIPMGAGLGGGSADAAYTLLMINEKFNLNLSREQLIGYALRLGSDCPFFIINQPCFATGRGEIMEAVQLNLSSYKILIVNPGIHVNTGAAFSSLVLSGTKNDLKQMLSAPIENWKDNIINDFENPVFTLYPEIAAIKQILYNNAAVYASMSGSGSTVYGIFPREHQPYINFPEHYFCQWV